MAENAAETRVTVMSAMRYQDAPAAIEWLCNAFGFDKHLVVPDGNGGIAHAELTFGNGMVMLGSWRDDAYGKVTRTPRMLDGANTASIYVVVADTDVHYRRAIAAGAKIFMDIVDNDYGGRGYSCFDLKGYVWSFGSFDPWK